MKKQDNTPVDFDKEVSAIVDYLPARWTVLPDMGEFVRAVAEKGWHDARGWLDRFTLHQHCRERRKAREEFLTPLLPPSGAGLARWYDICCRYLDALPSVVEELREASLNLEGRWDFEARAKTLYRSLENRFPGLADLRPLGWDALRKDYCDFKGIDEYLDNQQEKDYQDFKGFNIALGISPPFTNRVALPYVMYSEVGQRTKAPVTLVQAIYGHFLSLREHENMRQVRDSIKALDLGDQAREVVFDFKPTSDHPLTQILLQTVEAKFKESPEFMRDDFAKSCFQWEEFEKLSPEEQTARRNAAQEKLINELLKTL